MPRAIPPSSPSDRSNREARDLPVSFRTIFWVDVLFTVGAFLTNLYLVTRPAELQTDAMKNFAEGCNSVWKIGVGGFFGLLFGKGVK